MINDSPLHIDPNLIEKYNVPVPRYTSYPPANHFKEDFSEKDYLALVDESNSEGDKNISIYLHIPFCKKICHYCGCNACAIGTGNKVKPYLNALKKEITLLTNRLVDNRKVSQIHYGGGTPNALQASELKELNELVFSNFDFIEKPEIAIECNPAYVDKAYLDVLLEAGFNRFSFGIQDFNQQVLDTVNRDGSQLPVESLVQKIKGHDANNGVNLDFIYGLPFQTRESFLKTIEKAIAINPDRLVTFSYAHVPWMKKQQSILEKHGLPSSSSKMDMFVSA
ncbi:MAG: radical SAM protein, partial [Bacteroidales bacterium]|nr:radical SAM protein [Bacteroidales bacterium]